MTLAQPGACPKPRHLVRACSSGWDSRQASPPQGCTDRDRGATRIGSQPDGVARGPEASTAEAEGEGPCRRPGRCAGGAGEEPGALWRRQRRQGAADRDLPLGAGRRALRRQPDGVPARRHLPAALPLLRHAAQLHRAAAFPGQARRARPAGAESGRCRPRCRTGAPGARRRRDRREGAPRQRHRRRAAGVPGVRPRLRPLRPPEGRARAPRDGRDRSRRPGAVHRAGRPSERRLQAAGDVGRAGEAGADAGAGGQLRRAAPPSTSRSC
jgi:hypothetical protein